MDRRLIVKTLGGETTEGNRRGTMRGRSQFVGLAGQYHVAYALSVRGYHAAITMGNVPDVDILLAAPDGSRLLAIQVKTSRYAHRPKRYGHELREWDVSANAPGQSQENLWYTFVDLQEGDTGGSLTWNPVVFIVPSTWVGNFVKTQWSRKMFMLRKEVWESCQERWDRIGSYLVADPTTQSWIHTIPPELNW